VLVPHAMGQEQLIAPLSGYLHRYPGVAVEWLLHDYRPDFIAEGIDCAIQVGQVDDPTVVAVKLGDIARIAVASPGLMQGRPVPSHARELASLPWMALRTFYRDEVRLNAVTGGEVCSFPIKPRLSTDSLYAMKNAALEGVGACIASKWVVVDDIASGRLVHLAPDWIGTPLPIYLVYPHARFYPAKLSRFLEAVRKAVVTLQDATA
jgi:DNA-binding transcriptional LysR family regulator